MFMGFVSNKINENLFKCFVSNFSLIEWITRIGFLTYFSHYIKISIDCIIIYNSILWMIVFYFLSVISYTTLMRWNRLPISYGRISPMTLHICNRMQYLAEPGHVWYPHVIRCSYINMTIICTIMTINIGVDGSACLRPVAQQLCRVGCQSCNWWPFLSCIFTNLESVDFVSSLMTWSLFWSRVITIAWWYELC